MRSDPFTSGEVAQRPVLDVTEHLVGAPGGSPRRGGGPPGRAAARRRSPGGARHSSSRAPPAAHLVVAATGPRWHRLLRGEVALVLAAPQCARPRRGTAASSRIRVQGRRGGPHRAGPRPLRSRPRRCPPGAYRVNGVSVSPWTTRVTSTAARRDRDHLVPVREAGSPVATTLGQRHGRGHGDDPAHPRPRDDRRLAPAGRGIGVVTAPGPEPGQPGGGDRSRPPGRPRACTTTSDGHDTTSSSVRARGADHRHELEARAARRPRW